MSYEEWAQPISKEATSCCCYEEWAQPISKEATSCCCYEEWAQPHSLPSQGRRPLRQL